MTVTVDLDSDVQRRLHEVARQQALSVPELIERVLKEYLNSVVESPAAWVQTVQKRLDRVWLAEDFSGWGPPGAA